jgi:hypothetical protein
MTVRRKTNLLTLILTFFLLLAAIFSVPSSKKNLKASEPASFSISALAITNDSTNSVIYAYPTEEAKPTVNSWDHAFTFVEGTGGGFLYNGETYSGWELKQPGDFYIGLGRTAATGDVLIIDGTFYNDDKKANIIFNNSALL